MCNKRFKLIQLYPGSPEIGSIFEFGDWGLDNQCYQYKHRFNIHRLSKEVVERSPKYFEEINEPKFQILSYYAKNISGKGNNYVDPTYIWKEKSPGKWARFRDGSFVTGPYTTEEITNHNGYGIHSVKRLSDGEVFTIGDKINCNPSKSEIQNLFEIKIIEGEVRFKMEFQRDYTWDSSYTLNFISKPKLPLLITEDGVEIFEGGEFWEVFNNYSNIAKVSSDGIKTFLYNYDSRKAFSTKEKAEEFIVWSSKKYNLIDVEEALSVLNPYLGQPLMGNLKTTILNKLKSKL